MPSSAAFTALMASSERMVFYAVGGKNTLESVSNYNRNGYNSQSIAEVNSGADVVEFLYWDGVRAQKMNPKAGTGPTPYDW